MNIEGSGEILTVLQCDEQAPCCRNCKKRGVTCDFETSWPNSGTSSSASPDPAITSQSSAFTSTNLKRDLSPPCGVLSLQNIVSHDGWNVNPLHERELMHHYATILFHTIAADSDSYRPVWQIAVPREAQSYEFLMRGILAMSSLHLSHLWSGHEANTEQAQAYKQMALSHCNSATAAFRSAVDNITPSNANAIFAFSHLMILFSFGSSKRSATDLKIEDPIGELLNLFTLLRGSMQIVRQHWNWIESGSMGLLLQRGPPIKDRHYLPADAADALRYLEQLCEFSFTGDSKQGRIHQYAIQQLYDSFVMAEMQRPDWAIALRFPIIFPDSFFTCLRMREPMALVILAHYCVILYRAPMRWWVADWSAQVIEAVFRSLDENWRQSIRWPLKVIYKKRPPSV